MKKKSLTPLPESEYYAQDADGNVYYQSIDTGKAEPLKGMQADAFRYLGNFYSCDGTRIFYGSTLLRQNYQSYTNYGGYGYLAVDHTLYWYGNWVQEAFQGPLEVIAHHFYTDGSSLFVNGKRLSFHRDTFTVLSQFYAKDRDRVFHSDQVVEGADAASFEVIPSDSGLAPEIAAEFTYRQDKGYSSWTRDRFRLYNCGKPWLEGVIDPASVRVICHPSVLRDKNRVYYWETIVECLDPDSFQPMYRKLPDKPSTIPAYEHFSPFYRDQHTLYYRLEDPHGLRESRIVPLNRLKPWQLKPVVEQLLEHAEGYGLSEKELAQVRRLADS